MGDDHYYLNKEQKKAEHFCSAFVGVAECIPKNGNSNLRPSRLHRDAITQPKRQKKSRTFLFSFCRGGRVYSEKRKFEPAAFPIASGRDNPAKTTKKKPNISVQLLSGWQDSNLRPPAPKAGAITELRYTPNIL